MTPINQCTILLVLVLATNFAQAQTVYGVRAGWGLSDVVRKIDKKPNDGILGKRCFQIGIASKKLLFDEFVYGQLDFIFYSQKWKNTNLESTINLNYIQVNPMLKIRPPYLSRFYVQSGLYLGCAISGKNNDQKIQFGRKTDQMKAFDFGGSIGLGWLFDNIQFGFDMQFGFANLSNVKKITERNRNMMFNTTYLFGNRQSHPTNVNQTDIIGETYSTDQTNKKEKLFLHLSISPFIFFRMFTENEGFKVSTDIFGVSIGFDYYYSYNHFIHLEAFAFSNYPSNNEHIMSSESANLSNNHKFGRISLGYGFFYAKYTLAKTRWFSVVPIESHNAFGLVFPAYFHAAQFFNIGIVYKPTFYKRDMTNKFSYEYLVSIDFAWKIRLP